MPNCLPNASYQPPSCCDPSGPPTTLSAPSAFAAATSASHCALNGSADAAADAAAVGAVVAAGCGPPPHAAERIASAPKNVTAMRLELICVPLPPSGRHKPPLDHGTT